MSFLRIMTQQAEEKFAPIYMEEAAPAVSFKSTEQRSFKDNAPDKDDARKGTAIYAATNLEFWETDKSHYFADEISINGTCFRQLDPDCYVWFRHKMISAQAAHKTGKLSDTAWETLRERFNNLQLNFRLSSLLCRRCLQRVVCAMSAANFSVT